MRTPTSLLTLEACQEVLDEALERARLTGRAVLVALKSRPIREDLGSRLLDAPICPKLAWLDVSTGSRLVGLGETHSLVAAVPDAAWEAADHAQRVLEDAACTPETREHLRMLGGIAFDPTSSPHPDWPDGLPARFVLPRALVVHRASQSTLVMTTWAKPDETPNELLFRLQDDLAEVESWRHDHAPAALPLAEVAPAADAKVRWVASLSTALDRIASGEVTKVVLSRDLPVRAEAPFPMGTVLEALEALATSGHVFGFQFGKAAFVGATPELLVSLDDRMVRSDCLAGTVRRTGDAEEDDRLALSLLASDKDRREQQHVIAAVTEALAPVCLTLDVPETPTLMVLPTLQHLHTPVQGRLRDEVTLGTVIRRLHPTPAVGGTPRQAALGLIRELEGRPRGWYAGAVGWIGAQAATFAVGIRSAILHEQGAVVFGGAGIVEGSDPALEWDETQRKAATLLSLLTRGRDA